MTRVLFIGEYDWANIANRVARAINSVAGGATARVFTKTAHPFGFEEDMIGEKRYGLTLQNCLKTARWAVCIDGNYDYFLDILSRHGNHLYDLGTCHVGSAFRTQPELFNVLDARIGFQLRMVGSDMMRLVQGAPGVPFFAPPHQVVAAVPTLDGFRVAHSPSNRDFKGTTNILEVLQEIGVDLDLIEGVPFAECAKRRARCHVFVDQLEPTIGGFGASAVEALSSGCAVVADIHNVDPRGHWPLPPLIDVRTNRELYDAIRELRTEPKYLEALRAASLKWAQAYASPDAVGRYWLKYLEGSKC